MLWTPRRRTDLPEVGLEAVPLLLDRDSLLGEGEGRCGLGRLSERSNHGVGAVPRRRGLESFESSSIAGGGETQRSVDDVGRRKV